MNFFLKKKKFPYNTGNPVQFGGSITFNKEGIPSVGMAPENAGSAD